MQGLAATTPVTKHLTLKKEATKPAAGNFLRHKRASTNLSMSQQRKTSRSSRHEVSGGGLSAFSSSLHRLAGHHYPLHDKTIVVTRCGRICLAREKINFSQVFAGASGRHHGSARRHMAGQLYGFEPPTSPLSELRSVYLPRKNRFMSGDFVE